MAAPEKDSSAQTQTSAPERGAMCTTNVPANVVEAIKSSDLVPALFALPCDSGDNRKLKLCKRVGWLRDGVFTTGYIEMNIKEAKQKGIFSQPRRVTLVRKEDSSFHSVIIGTGSKTPPCDLLSTAMLKRKSSTTAMIDVNGVLNANLITIGKDSMLTAETSGKLVALNQSSTAGTDNAEEAVKHSESSGPCSLPTDDTRGYGTVCTTPPKEQHKSHIHSSESNKLISDSKDCGNNNATTLSTNSDKRKHSREDNFPQNMTITSVKDGHAQLPATEYFLTEGGKASPMKRRSNPDSALDFPDTPAFRKLQQLMHIVNADLEISDAKTRCSSSLSKQHDPANETDLSMGPTPAKVLNQVADLLESKELHKTATLDRVNQPATVSNSKSRTTDINPNMGAAKRNVDFSSHDTLQKEGMFSAAKTTATPPSCVPTVTRTDSDSEIQTQRSKILSKTSETTLKPAVSNVNHGNPEIQAATTSGKNLNPNSSESRQKSLILSDSTPDQLAVNSPSQKGSPSSVTSSSTESATSDVDGRSSPLTHVDDGKRTFQARTEDCPTQKNQTLCVGVRQTPTIIQCTGIHGDDYCQNPVTQISMAQTSVSMNKRRTTDDTLSRRESENPSKDGSGEFPTLQIGSVYSLSEKEAKERFPEPRSQEPENPIPIKQEPVDNYKYSNLLIPDDGADDEDPASGSKTTSAVIVKKEPIDSTENIHGTNLKSLFKVTSTATVSQANLNAKNFPFSNSSNVQLYNITPITGTPVKRTVKRKSFTPVTRVAPTPQPYLLPSNFVVQIPAAGLSNTNVPPQVDAGPTKQLPQWLPSNLPANTNTPQLITLLPVQLGSLQVTTGEATYVTPPSTLSTNTNAQAVLSPLPEVPSENTAAPSSNAKFKGIKAGQAMYATRTSTTRSTSLTEKMSSVSMTPVRNALKSTVLPASKSETPNLTVVSQTNVLPPSKCQPQKLTIISQSTAISPSKSQTMNLPVISQSTLLPPSKSQTPTVLNLPVVPQSPGNKRIVITSFSREVPPGARPAPAASVSFVGGARQTIPMPSSVISKMFTALNTSKSGQTIVSSPGFASKPFPSTMSPIPDSHTVNKTVVVTGASTAKNSGGKDSTPAQLKSSRLELNPSKQPQDNPLFPGPKKTFLITTSNGEKRLVSLPSNADAAAILSQMASNKAYQFVVPQNATEDTKPKEGNEKHGKKEKEVQLRTRSPSSKKAHTSAHKHKYKHKTARKPKEKLPILKIKFKKEPEVEPESGLRRSARERKLKRSYSPPKGVPRGSKVARCDTPSVDAEETKPSPSAPDSLLPFIKTEPVIPDEAYAGDDMFDVEDSLLPRPPSPPSPPSYVNREDRVRRLKELMREKEKALEEILKRRKHEMEERLADPQLCDL